VLFVQVEGKKREIRSIATDGGNSRALATGCDSPVANRAPDSVVCIGEDQRALFAYPLEGGTNRLVYRLPTGEQFRYARWNNTGDKILAVTAKGRLLTVSASKSELLSEEQLPLPGSETNAVLFTAALTERGTLQAYSVARLASSLYLVSGLR
jgi:hypothetical protein